jgi:peroxidase
MIIFFASITCSVHSQQIKVIKSLEEIVESVPRSIQPKRLSDKDIHEMFLNVSSSLDKDQAELPMSIHKLSSIGIGVARQIYQMGIQPYELYNAPVEFCPYAEKPECDHNYQYRSYDGSCNNEKYPWYGMKNTPFRRLLKPAYHDNINEPRLRSTTGRLLSNPRKIAMDVHNPLDEYSDKFSSLLPHYAQFVAHDMSLIQLINEKSEKSDKPIKCYCYIDNSNCIKINMPKSDKINEDQECMSTPRSSASFKSFNCDLGAREQLNSKSHYLDLSQVYGTDTTEISNLRQFNGGLLKSATFNGNKKFQYLPFDKEGDCDEIKKDMNCLRAGDRRLLQNLHLASMHTIWMRMHNMMAENLKELNPSWDDEKLFQESRKMCSAMYQHTIYNEYLPVLLSSKVAEMYEIHSETVGYSSKYDPKVYPSVLNEAITAALRFGHSMVRSEYTHVDSKYREHGELPISAIVFNTEKAFDNHTSIDTFIRSSVYNRAGKYDTHINDFLTNHLFENPKSERNKRVSLPALNIMVNLF